MKVSYITMMFPFAPETFACTDVRMLRNAGVDVSVQTMRAPKAEPTSLLRERGLGGLAVSQGTLAADLRGVVSCLQRPALVARLLTWIVGSTWSQPVALLKSIALVPRSVGILSCLQRNPPDVVHLFWGHYPSIVGYLVLRALPSTVLSVFLGAYDLTRSYGGTKWVASRADLVWTHARCNIPAIRALGVPSERIRVVYRGVDPGLFNGRSVPKIKGRIVTAGSLVPEKGMDDVLQVFRVLRAKWPTATLHVLGEGAERDRLERLSRSHGTEDAVRFLGHLPQEEVAAQFSAAEIFVLMSRKESERLPNVVKEAMACRCVCVVTRTPGVGELVVDGQNGFLVHQGDIHAAVGRIDDVFGGRVDVRRLVNAAELQIASLFDASTSMALYRRHWADSVTSRRPRHRRAGLASSVEA